MWVTFSTILKCANDKNMHLMLLLLNIYSNYSTVCIHETNTNHKFLNGLVISIKHKRKAGDLKIPNVQPSCVVSLSEYVKVRRKPFAINSGNDTHS